MRFRQTAARRFFFFSKNRMPGEIQRKIEGALRVRASDDPAAVHQLMWAFKNPATTGLHTLCGRVDVADIEIIKPIRDRLTLDA